MDKISDRTTSVIAALGNRTDILSKVRIWFKEAYTEIAMGYDFEELETTVNDLFIPSIDEYTYPATARAIKAVTLIFSDGRTRPIRRRHIRVVENYSNVVKGPPSIYAPYGPSILVRPLPDIQYESRWRIWEKPLITDPVENTELKLPADWLKVLDYTVLERGHTELLERDKTVEIHQILHGGQDVNTGRRWPGLLKQLSTRRQKEAIDEDYAIAPLGARYTNTI